MTTPPNNPPAKRPRTAKQIAKGFQPGKSGNPLGRALERKIDGVPISSFMTNSVGPAALKVTEKILHNALQKSPDDIKPFEVDLARWAIERVYGRATENININANVNTTTDKFITTDLTIEQMEMIASSIKVIEVDAKNDDDV